MTDEEMLDADIAEAERTRTERARLAEARRARGIPDVMVRRADAAFLKEVTEAHEFYMSSSGRQTARITMRTNRRGDGAAGAGTLEFGEYALDFIRCAMPGKQMRARIMRRIAELARQNAGLRVETGVEGKVGLVHAIQELIEYRGVTAGEFTAEERETWPRVARRAAIELVKAGEVDLVL